MRHLRVLGLALLAVFAMAAVTASAASAETFPQKTALTTTSKTKTSVVVTAEAGGTQTFSTTGANVTCTTVKIPEKTVELPATTLEVHPEFGNCKAFGGNATVTTTGCNFVFHITETLKAGEEITASTTVVCEMGKAITITNVATKCIVTVGSQNVPDDLVIDNAQIAGGKDDLTLTANYNPAKTEGTGITYTEDANCPNPGERTNGKYVGNTTVKGFTDVGGKESAAEDIRILPE